MSDKNKDKQRRLERRKWSLRSNLFGTPERPRLSVYRSSKHIYVQLIDDYAGKTLAAVASTNADVRGELKTGANIAAAQQAGTAIAQKAKELGVTKVAFDRGGRKYHGRVKALADAARKAGLQF
ncbi:MAG TPA: 50S ribosomal protein L18 [Tepidisphaeraceae bacterium]|jgi:large subunit ribosomal protein L18|nr:50S ribosomal protein L18 [Tepidisphaeraceae bacterium]